MEACLIVCSNVLLAKSGLGETIGVVPLGVIPGVARALRGFSIFFGSVPVLDVGVLDALAGRRLTADFGRGGRLLSEDSSF